MQLVSGMLSDLSSSDGSQATCPTSALENAQLYIRIAVTALLSLSSFPAADWLAWNKAFLAAFIPDSNATYSTANRTKSSRVSRLCTARRSPQMPGWVEEEGSASLVLAANPHF